MLPVEAQPLLEEEMGITAATADAPPPSVSPPSSTSGCRKGGGRKPLRVGSFTRRSDWGDGHSYTDLHSLAKDAEDAVRVPTRNSLGTINVRSS
jgi:hypothetical protein